jgi:hypothetical protein
LPLPDPPESSAPNAAKAGPSWSEPKVGTETVSVMVSTEVAVSGLWISGFFVGAVTSFAVLAGAGAAAELDTDSGVGERTEVAF